MPGGQRGVFVVAASVLLIAGFVPADPLYGQEAAPVATWVGWETCSECHDELAAGFEYTVHGRLASWELYGQGRGCEACHGPGSLHADSGDPELIQSFSVMDTEASTAACLTCHEGRTAMEWAGGTHAMAGVACADCHSFHQPRQVLASTVPTGAMVRYLTTASRHAAAPAPGNSAGQVPSETCLACHTDVRAKFEYTSHHPLVEGYMDCASCHLADGSIHGDSMVLDRVTEACRSCHPSHEGPWVFEHAPVEEDCLICHNPHGSVADNLLVQNEPFVCLQCHEQHFHAARLGAENPIPNHPTGGYIPNANGKLGFMAAFNTKCTSCHPAIHGSDLPSLSVPGQGKALVR
jgi:DmsE family decaheme c-type cytochrome